MENQISDPNPANGAAANPATDPAAVNGTVQTNGEANQQGASVEETFGNVDPKTLPPQLRSVYDNMLRGFKEKTTKLSETVKSEVTKATEAYRQKADWYDAALKDEKLVSMINDYVKSLSQASDPSKANIPPELQQKLEKVDQLERKMQETEALTSINAFAEAKNEKGELLRPDFDKYHSIVIGTHPQAGEYSILRAAIELAPGETPQEKMENGYKAVDAVYKAALEEGKKIGMGRVQTKAQNASFSPSSVAATGTAPHRAKNALEALDFARRGLVPAKD